MAEIVNINKTAFNKSQFILAVDTKFSELFAQKTPLTVDQFFTYYNDLFFAIPNIGKKSHQELIERSTEYVGEDPFEGERNAFLKQITTLEYRVAELENVEDENPIFPNGSFLRYDDFSDRPEGGVIFYMVAGVRRQLTPGGELMTTIVKATNPEARKLSAGEYSNHQYIQNVPSSIMDQIELGKPFTYNDFSGKNKGGKTSKTTAMLNKAIAQAEIALRGDSTNVSNSKGIPKSKKFITNSKSKNK